MMKAGTTIHPRSIEFQQKRLFCDLDHFSELEERITALRQEDRGPAFEAFAEAYVATQPRFQAKHVWLGRNIPRAVRTKLSLPRTDKGADGIYEDQEGSFHALQMKFRSNREPLTWTEWSTFFGIADRVQDKWVFTNSTKVDEVSEDRQGFITVYGHDLDRLERQDFSAIDSWIQGDITVPKPNEPRDYQRDPIKDCLDAFKTNDRASCVMACGTGKTLVALWIAERLQ